MMMITDIGSTEGIINFANQCLLKSTEENKKVYNDLKDAIDKGDGTRGILKSCTAEEIISFLCVNNGESDPLIIQAIEKYEEVLKEIYSQIYSKEDKAFINYANKILQDKALEDLMKGDGIIATKIIKFAVSNPNWGIFPIVTTDNGLLETVKKGDVDLAVKIYTTYENMYKGNYYMFYRLFIMRENLKDAISYIKCCGEVGYLKNILMFAKGIGKLEAYFDVNVYFGKNLLQFAVEKRMGGKVNTIIKECGIDLKKHVLSSTLSQFYEDEFKEDDNPLATAPSVSSQAHDIAYTGRTKIAYTGRTKDETFYKKNNNYCESSSTHEGKIAMIAIGVMLAPVGIAILFAMGNLTLGISLMVLASIMVVIPVLALTTKKGEELLNKVSNVFTCQTPELRSA